MAPAGSLVIVSGDVAEHLDTLTFRRITWHKIAGVRLDVPMLTMRDIPADGNHCVITAVTSLINYYRADGKALPVLSVDEASSIATLAARSRGYSKKRGVMPWRIAGVAQTALQRAGAQSARARNRYLWTLRRTLIPELTARRPFLMNIARGDYARHTVLVTGYESWRADGDAGTERHLLIVHDGWSDEPRLLDYTAFMRDLRSGIIASVTTITPWRTSPRAQADDG